MTLVLFFQTGFIIAQNIEFTPDNFPRQATELNHALNNIKRGDMLYYKRMYFDAIDFYIKANRFNPDNAVLNYKIGKCYLFTIDKVQALTFLLKAYELNSSVADDILFLIARGYHITHNFDNAIEYYKEYKNLLSLSELTREGKIIDKHIQECNYGKEFILTPSRVFIDNIGQNINSLYPEYNPIVNADESMLIFTSRRPDGTSSKRDPADQGYFEDIYISYRGKDEEWQKPVNPGRPLNSRSHNAAAGLSPDGQQLFVYMAKGGGDIYLGRQDGIEWTKPKNLSKINSRYHESSVSLSPDERSMYFSTDRPGGFGGRDIYVSHKNAQGEWEEPKTLPIPVNTPYDEEGVFMHPDGKTLYFSSNGHNSMGGYDIFKSIYENKKWSIPENLGYPINTADDDVFFSISANGRHGYYSSARPGGYGQQDIYVITFLGVEKPMVNNTEDNLLAWKTKPVSGDVIEEFIDLGASLLLFKGRVLDDVTKEPVEADIILTDNELNKEIARFKSNKVTGRFLISLPIGRNYGITVNAPGYLFHSENFIVPKTVGYKEIEKDIYLKTLTVGSSIVLSNIFFDFAKSTLRPESKSELANVIKLLKDNPGLKIEISGHTDNIGSIAYNKKLSEDRAKSVINYLVEHGIKSDKLKYAGYGFDRPIASNETDEGRQQNRRTEFEIIGGAGQTTKETSPGTTKDKPLIIEEEVKEQPKIVQETYEKPDDEKARKTDEQPLAEKFYIIAGSATTFKNAKVKKNYYAKQGFKNAGVLEDANNVFMVYLKSYTDKEKANKDLKKFKKKLPKVDLRILNR